MSNYYAHETAVIDSPTKIGDNSKIWHFTHIREGVVIGENCIIGQNCYIDEGVIIGNNVKIQNGVSVYKGVTIEDDVFVGPNATFTNDKYPSAIGEWQVTKTLVRKGAAIGANATIVCGVCIGEDVLIGAGSVVSKNIPPKTVVVGNPARALKKQRPEIAQTDKIKISIIGVGKMGKFHLSKALANNDLQVIGYYDVSQDTISQLEKKYPNLKAYETIDNLLYECDAVVVASPSPLHYEHVLKALKQGKDVLCEKPLTTCFNTSKELVTFAENNGLILQPGQVERYNPTYQALRNQIQEELYAIKTSRAGSYSEKHAKTSIVYDLVVHDLDLIVYLLKEPLKVLSVWGKKIYSPTYDIVNVCLESESGVLVDLLASRVTEKRLRNCKIHLKNKYIEGDLLNRVLHVTLPPANNSNHIELYKNIEQCYSSNIIGKDQLQNQLSHFVESIKTRKPVISNNEMLIVAKILEDIESQL